MKRTTLLYSLLLGALFATAAMGQNSQSYLNDTGSTAYGIIIPVENGFINVSNGNMHLEFPLATHPQRGALSLSEKLVYDSRIWMFSSFGTHGSYHWWPYNVYGSSPTAGGWRFVSGNEIGTVSYSQISYTQQVCNPDDGQISYYQIESLTWTDPGGTAHPFTAGRVSYADQCASSSGENINSGPAADGSGYSVHDDGSGNPVILDSNGTQVYPKIIDRYGNYWSADSNNNLIDDTGRTPVIVTQNGNVTYYDVLSPNGTIDNNGKRIRYTVTTAQVTVATNFQQSDTYEFTLPGELIPVKSILLPDGSQYTFDYDSYGELSTVTLPTGGTIHYDYTNFFDSSNTANRWLTSRTVGSDPATTFTPKVITSCANYSSGCVEQVNLHKPSGDETVYEFTLNNGAWNTGVTSYTGSAASGQQMSHTTNVNQYTNGCPAFNQCIGANYLSQSLSTTVLPTATGSISTQIQSLYNSSNGKPSHLKEWDYYTGSASAIPTRQTDYVYTATGFDVQQVTVLDSAGNPAGQTNYGYTTTAQPTSGIAQHGTTNAGGPYLQTVSHWLNTGAAPVTTYAMDDTGMVLSVTDPKQNPATTFSYQCSNALHYDVTNALGQKTRYGYDCSSGAITSVQDPNDLAMGRAGTTYAYESAGRVQSVTSPDGGQTSYSYPSSVEVHTTVLANPNPSISSSDIADNFGRPYQHVQGGVSTETSYDANGRVYCVTNPHFVSVPAGPNTCITLYDGLDRPKTQMQPDGSSLGWSYSGNVTTSSDEVGNSWQRTSNAFGKLTGVVEPGGLLTSYSYDGLGNLSSMTQNGGAGEAPRTRSFTYDSLSRQIKSTTPEVGTVCYGVWSGSNCINGYDANGNLVAKTDARGVTTNFVYDALNRVTFKNSAGANGVPGFNYLYGYDVVTPVTEPNGIGRLLFTTTDPGGVNGVAQQYFYDPMGRLTSQISYFPSHPSGGVVTSANYDLAGNTASLTYPDGRTVSQGFDGAGRMSSVNYLSWNGIGHSTPYLTVNPSNGYDPAGHLLNATMGNGIALAAGYDNRDRVGMLAYGTSAQLQWGKRYQWSPNGNLQNFTDSFTGVQRQFGYDTLNRLKTAQDIFGSSQGANTSPFPTGSGNTSVGSSSGATPTPSWTDPDDSNILPEIGETDSHWDPGYTQVVVNGALAPDGTMTATSVTATATDDYIAGYVPSPESYDGETMTASVWLRCASGTITLNLFKIDQGPNGRGYLGSRQIQVTTAWQQFQVSGPVQNNLTGLLLQVGGGGGFTSGETLFMWRPMMEDEGTAGATVTNFLPYSQRLTASTWGVIRGTATDNSAVAPDGTNTGATITATSGSTDSYFVDSVPNPAPYSGSPVTGSIWLRSPTGPQSILITLINFFGTNGYATLGEKTVALTSDWQRFEVSATNQSTLTTLLLQIGGANTFVNGQSVQAWGAQMELASSAGPYVATGATPVSAGTNLTNILSYSQQPNGSSWGGTGGGSGVINAVDAPDGSHTGYEFTYAGGIGWMTNDVIHPALYNNATLTESVFLRSPTGSDSVNVYLFGENASGRVLVQGTNAQLTSSWKRFTLTGQAPNGMTRLLIQVGDTNSPGKIVDLWGTQLEVASNAGPYVATSALPVVSGKELMNILPNSQQLNGPSWGVVDGTTTINSAVAPDGSTTAATMTANSSNTYVIDSVPNPSLYDQQTVTGSVYLRVPSGVLNTNLYIINFGEDNAGGSGIIWAAPGQTAVTLTTTWQRFSVTGTNLNGLTQLILQIGGAGTLSPGQSIQIWGAQMVIGTTAAPYDPTASGTSNIVTGQPATLVPTGLNQTYSYDSFGNIQQNGSFNSSYTSNNQMFGYAYDAAGNLLSNGLTAMTWDAESRLVSADGATYIYDADGNRVEKQGIGVTDTVYFRGAPIARYSAGGWNDLIYGPNGLLAEVPGTENGDPAYRLVDHLGSAVGMIGSNGLLVNPLDHTPYGQPSSGTSTDPYKFAGLERDDETGFDHTQFRQYSSTNGRWISPDPYNGSYDLSNPQSFNRYSYVGNMPLGFTDPSGLEGGASAPVCWSAAVQGGANPVSDVACGLFLGIDALLGFKIAGLFSHSAFTASHTSRPGAIWDEHGGFQPHADIAGALGLPSGGCEFGSCGGGFAAGGPSLFDNHHIYPQQFAQWFEDHGVDIEKYTMPLLRVLHTRRPLGIHTKLGGDWNGVWRKWIAENPNASPQEILNQGKKMLLDFGIMGSGAMSDFLFIVNPCVANPAQPMCQTGYNLTMPIDTITSQPVTAKGM